MRLSRTANRAGLPHQSGLRWRAGRIPPAASAGPLVNRRSKANVGNQASRMLFYESQYPEGSRPAFNASQIATVQR